MLPFLFKPGVRTADLPNLGPVLDAANFVGDLAGTGLFSATALASYVNASPGGAASVAASTTAALAAAATAQAAALALLRKPCVGNTTFYVDGVLGTDDVRRGLTAGAGAFASIQFAINTIQTYYDGSGFNGTISVAGTGGQVYNIGATGIQVYQPFWGFETMTLSCNGASNSVILLSSGPVIDVEYGAQLYITGGFFFSSSGSGENVVQAIHGGKVFLSGPTIGPSATGVLLYGTRFGYVEIVGSIHIASGTSFNLIQSSHQGNVRHSNGAEIIFDGNANFTDAVIYCDYADVTITDGATFNQQGFTVAGQQYRVSENGLIQWAAGSATSIPGSLVGTEELGGRYFYGGDPVETASGSFTFDMSLASGQAINVVPGFIPGQIDFLASVVGGAAGMMASVGWASIGYNGSNPTIGSNQCVAGGFAGAQPNTNDSVFYVTDDLGANSCALQVNGFLFGTGFTMVNTQTGSPTGILTVMWRARRGL